ncbi:MAG: LysR family transcriptional regulator, partial [Bacteriovoracaceae bacterium]|nr:LysR family transcriptional regulator [Bacteriovoracaceae bacterium]
HMSLSSLYLDAFYAVVQNGSFTNASKALAITQSALSQRVLNLENELGKSLFIRETTGLRLTESGEELLQYVTAKVKMENQVVQNILGEDETALKGEIKIGSISTITRSIVFPALCDIIRNNENLHVEIFSKELSELAPMSRSGEVDIVISYEPITRQGWKSEQIGIETNVLCQSSKYKNVSNKFLDHDIEDSTTKEFFKLQKGKNNKIVRDYYDDIYQIIDATEKGFGKAVIPKHLILENKKIKVLEGHKDLVYPIFLSSPDLAFTLKPIDQSIDAIRDYAPKLLI